MAKRKQTFEQSLKNLEEVVEKMESGELPLDKCLDQYEKGVKLAAFCARELDAAQQRIEKLQKDEKGEFATEPMEDAEVIGDQ